MNPTLHPLTPTRTRTPRHRQPLETRVPLVVVRAPVAPHVGALASGARLRARRPPPVGHLTRQLYVSAALLSLVLMLTQEQAPTPSNVLGVFGLSIRTQERDLDDEFSRFGRVDKVTIVYDQRVRFATSLCQAWHHADKTISLVGPVVSDLSRWPQSRMRPSVSTSSTES